MRSLLIALLLLPINLPAAEGEPLELESRTTKLHISYRVNDDFTVEETREAALQVLTDKAASNFKSRRLSHSTSIEKLKVLEAYTLKADGRKIIVPDNNYQVTINKGQGKAGAIFSDRTSVTVVFPEVEKGDTLYMRTRRTETEPMFPGQVSVSGYFYNQVAHDDVLVRFDLPEKMAFKHEVRQMQEQIRTRDGRRVIELRYQHKQPIKTDRQDFSVWDQGSEAGYALSTFAGYAEIAAAYAERALPKAVPTERVKTLAREIIGDEKDRRRQARLLYDWVASNISYAGNCIGVGAVVPHDTDFILENRMGDCKDHATLLEALYRAAGIDSIQALINSGSRYQLPAIPMVTAVNHVINYLPEWDQFVDSTNADMPFDQLSMRLLDKPVILVKGHVPGRRTPAMHYGDNSQSLTSDMKIHADGSISGNIRVTLKGLPAVHARRAWRGISKKQEEDWMERAFSSRSQVGFATMEKPDPTPLLSEYNYTINFKRPEFIPPKGVGGFYIYPLDNGPQGVFSYLDYANDDIEGYDIACGNGHAVEQLSYELPAGMSILATPDDVDIDENHLHFVARHTLKGNTLKVYREITDTTPANICSAELINRQRQTLIRISEPLRSQVIYKH